MEWEYSYFIIDSKQLEVSGEKWYPMHRLWKNQTPTGIIAIVHQSIFIGLYQGLSYPGGARAPVCPPDILTNRPRHKNCCAVSLQIMHSNVLGVLYRLNLNISFMHSILNYKMSNYIGVFSYLSSNYTNKIWLAPLAAQLRCFWMNTFIFFKTKDLYELLKLLLTTFILDPLRSSESFEELYFFVLSKPFRRNVMKCRSYLFPKI